MPDFIRIFMLIRTFVCFFLLYGATSISVGHAKDYYVWNEGGKDTNKGESWQNAWASLSMATKTLAPGDTVTIRPTSTPYHQLKILKSGLPDSPITYQGESNSDLPIITGGREIKDWSQTRAANIWRSPIQSPTNIVLDKGQVAPPASTATLSDGAWYWTDGYLYYKSNTGKPADQSIRYSAKPGGAIIRNHSWITLKNLSFKLGLGPGISIQGGSNNRIDNVVVSHHWQGIHISRHADRNVIENCVAKYNKEGIYIMRKSSNNVIRKCTVTHNGNHPQWNKGDRAGIAIGEEGPNIGNTIENCEIAYNGGPNSNPALIAYRAPDTLLSNNNVHDNHSSGIIVTIRSNGSTIEHNKVENNGNGATSLGEKGISGISVRSSDNVSVINNIINNNSVSHGSRWPKVKFTKKAGLDIQGLSTQVLSNIIIKNNVITKTKNGPQLYISKEPSLPGLIVENNQTF